jgi:hypothetical protein
VSSLRRLLALLALAVGLSVLAAAPVHAQGGGSDPPCPRLVDYDPTQFTQSTTIDNRFLPLVPGTQMVLEGRASRTGEPLPHRVTFTVTDLVKVIDGVRTRVMWDVDEQDGEVAEAELAFFAQDDDGSTRRSSRTDSSSAPPAPGSRAWATPRAASTCSTFRR